LKINCKSKGTVGKANDLHTLKINCKSKGTVGKANKGVNVEKNNRFLKVKN